LHSYQGFIDQLLTQIHHISLKFNHWWSFKPNCALQKYLLEHEIILDEYFSSDALCNALYHLFDLKNLHHENNKDILVLTSSLQLCFESFLLYKPHLLESCKHLLVRAPCEIETQLKNDYILNNLNLECTKDIIYQDPSSIFYLYPQINKLMETGQHVFQWKELILLFQDFCTTQPAHFFHNSSFIYVKKNSPWSNLLPFQYFHIDQSEIILKQITKYLGRKPLSSFSCPYFQKPLFPNPIFNEILQFIEDKIDEEILPQFFPSIQV
jgi:hypothetical protein